MRLRDCLSATKVIVVVVHARVIDRVTLVLGCDATPTPAEHQAVGRYTVKSQMLVRVAVVVEKPLVVVQLSEFGLR